MKVRKRAWCFQQHSMMCRRHYTVNKQCKEQSIIQLNWILVVDESRDMGGCSIVQFALIPFPQKSAAGQVRLGSNDSFLFCQLVIRGNLELPWNMAEQEEEYYGYYYGDDEDRGLLDPAWERQQKKVSCPVCM